MPRIAIATMARGRDPREADQLIASLGKLAAVGYPLFITDDPASTPAFTQRLSGLPRASVAPGGETLAARTRDAIQRAFAAGHDLVIYTEPDKTWFFENALPRLIEQAASAPAAIVLAARDHASFQTFPAGQRYAEAALNGLARNLLGDLPDLLYGPFAMRRDAVENYIQCFAGDSGWGWRIYLFARCALAGQKICAREAWLPCPADQAREDHPRDRAYRLKQLAENIEGLRRAIVDHAASGAS